MSQILPRATADSAMISGDIWPARRGLFPPPRPAYTGLTCRQRTGRPCRRRFDRRTLALALELAMFGSIGMPELIIILVIALIIFGPRKLPELGQVARQEHQRVQEGFHRAAEHARAGNQARGTEGRKGPRRDGARPRPTVLERRRHARPAGLAHRKRQLASRRRGSGSVQESGGGQARPRLLRRRRAARAARRRRRRPRRADELPRPPRRAAQAAHPRHRRPAGRLPRRLRHRRPGPRNS